MRGLTDVTNTLTSAVTRARAAWAALAPRTRLAATAGAVVLVIGGIVAFATSGRSCGERADVEARVAILAAANQADAASGKITVSQLAERTKKLNAAATAFETSKDMRTFCEALDDLDEVFKQPF